ncbi:1-deoxy-D-xylulose-5-phosphate reductoisomerase [Saccharopolyspora sp. HNM0983]|uniref:1-deoxy-D-xylulose 5-phosphate reductoisomerase n=1 Tax=Saccharopolyspora montiporae TaxID=2781240 RepID=A0A929B6X3_9PSEU|nr:1-deoxy-D-xylulose-5-phosphate reductoisomerase [Saccharopolyspora sp. HNM0983]MBE9374354.1 1-deoxy-D-xylulose-5-phosphate reductoisomerase [Saccharopolyspora sp. HNM0983]
MAAMYPDTAAPAATLQQPADRERADAPRSVLVLGSTGSIGTQALDLIDRNPDRFRVAGLAAGGRDPRALAEQAVRFHVGAVAVGADAREEVERALRDAADRSGLGAQFRMPRLLTGPGAVTELIDSTPADVVLNGVDGSRGLPLTLHALATGAQLALANKESLIAGGPLVLDAASRGQIVPVDSEHSALAQSLGGGRGAEVSRLVLTASGGPFRGRKRADLVDVTVQQALAHPTWSMGDVVTINSATLVNKGLELIEAHLLFGVDYDRIDVVVHPQSIVHSMVTFLDGSTLAQASPPNMRIPIALGLDWPRRVPDAAPALDFSTAQEWTFEPVDDEAFPAVELARHAGSGGGCLPAVYNAANEQALAAFVDGRLGFTEIVHTVGRVLADADRWKAAPAGLDDVFAAEEWARVRADELITARKVQ